MSNPNRTTDEFGWGQVILDPNPYEVPPTHHGDAINLVRRNTTDDQQWQPDETIVGPVHGQSFMSPWFGNTYADYMPQVSQGNESTGPASGGTNGPTTWRQWLAATEEPVANVASETFAAVYEFPYSFRG